MHALCPSFIDTAMVNAETMARDPSAAKLVGIFGGLLDKDMVTDACFEKLIDDSKAKCVLRITPHEGVAYDEPSMHPAERKILMAGFQKDPVKMFKRMFFPRKKRKSN